MRLPDYTASGEGKVTIFLLHGIYGSKEYWRPQTERLLARGYRVVAWDAPGYGLSRLPDPFSFDVVAEAGAALVRALGTERNVFHGHSMGGQITPRIRMKAPDRVHGIVISSTIGYFANRTKEEQEEFVRKRTAPPPPGTDPVTANRIVVDGMLGPASKGAEVDLVRHWASLTPPDTVKAAVKAVQTWPEADAIAGFKAIPVPTLLVAGEVDQVGHPAGMQRVSKMIAGCEFGTVPGSGHYPWAENPEEFNRFYFGYLDRHFPARA
jgi:pimeloyl-ACP methyl ester carboxylesterase